MGSIRRVEEERTVRELKAGPPAVHLSAWYWVDAVIYLLDRSLSHLETTGSTVKVMFLDFSSPFNTIQPSLLKVKLEKAEVECPLAVWTTNYLRHLWTKVVEASGLCV